MDTTNSTPLEPLLIDVVQVSKLLGISRAQVFEMCRHGKMPARIKLESSTRWSFAELKAWTAAGAPSRREWERIRKQQAPRARRGRRCAVV